MHYLLTWRMQLAQSLFDQSDVSIREVADRVGYESEVAFHRAFKRWVGQPPATWRGQGVRKMTAWFLTTKLQIPPATRHEALRARLVGTLE